MKKFDKSLIARNVGSSWFSLGTNVVTGIFVSPYILHHIGDEAFGIWVLIFSTTGYYGLFDLGIRSSIVRYVARYTATGECEELNRLINTAMFSYTGIGVAAMIVTVIASRFVDSIFRIPPAFVGDSRWLLLMVGGSIAVGFPLGVFGGILEGLQRFYLLNLVNIISTILRAVLIILALNRGGGLIVVALITVLLPLGNSIVNAVAALHQLKIRVHRKFVDMSTLRVIAGYSSTTLLITVASRLRFKTDALVIGTFVSASAITYFSIGSRLVDYCGDLVSSLAQIFIPMSSQSQAKGDIDGLRKIFVLGNRACAFIIFPITAILTVLGKSVIEAWVGPQYVSRSYPVLLVLLYPMTLMLAQSASGRTLWGMAKHRTWAFVVLAEGISNLILSIVLVRPYGIMGDAAGTAIPLTCSMILFLPHHLCKLLGIRLGTYLRRAFVLPLVLCIPLIATLLLMQRWFIPHHYGQLLVQLAIATLVYGAGLSWAVWSKRALDVGDLSGNPASNLNIPLVETLEES